MSASPFRILLVVGTLSRSAGGLSVYVAQLANALGESGAQVRVTAEKSDGVEPEHATGAAERICLPTTHAEWQRIIAWADVLHVNGLWVWANHCAILEARRQGKPYLVSIHGMLERQALSFSRYRKRLAYWLYQRRDLMGAAALHATAELELASIRELGFGQPVVVAPPGVNLSVFTRDFNAGESERRMLFIGRLHPIKGLEACLRAWAHVRPLAWRFEIVGPDEVGHQRELVALATQLGIGTSVEFSGSLAGEAKELAFSRADVLVLPSLTENFGIVVAEALAHGLPVITTRGTPWRVLEDRACGWHVDHGMEPLAAAIKEVVSLGPVTLSEMGARAKLLAVEKFGWSGVATLMLDVYAWLKKGKGAPAPSIVSINHKG